MRLATVFGLVFLVACNDPADPGDPVPLTPQSLEGKWVRIRVVLSTSTVSDTTEIPENGEIYEFTESGGVKYSCRCPRFDVAPTPQYNFYSITGDTLWLHQEEGVPHPRLAEVTTRRLILRSLGTSAVDITGDGVPEDVRIADIYRRE